MVSTLEFNYSRTYTFNMNVQANHTKNFNNVNIYITHNLGYNPF